MEPDAIDWYGEKGLKYCARGRQWGFRMLEAQRVGLNLQVPWRIISVIHCSRVNRWHNAQRRQARMDLQSTAG